MSAEDPNKSQVKLFRQNFFIKVVIDLIFRYTYIYYMVKLSRLDLVYVGYIFSYTTLIRYKQLSHMEACLRNTCNLKITI